LARPVKLREPFLSCPNVGQTLMLNENFRARIGNQDCCL